LVRDVVEIFRRCAQHPQPPTEHVAELPVDQLADVFADAVNEPWRAAAEDARIRQALAEAANGYNQHAGLVLPWPAVDANGVHVRQRTDSSRRRSDPTGERLLHTTSRLAVDQACANRCIGNRARKCDHSQGGQVWRQGRRRQRRRRCGAAGVSAPAAMTTSTKKSAQRRKAAVVAAVLVTNDDASSGDELVEWTQCERCDRWVVLPPHMYIHRRCRRNGFAR
jgi:hypothetical protein